MVTRPVTKHIRGFVIIWLTITLVMGMATFLAIYFSYSTLEIEPGAGNPLPLDTAGSDEQLEEVVLVLPSALPQPTHTPTVIPPSPSSSVFVEEVTAEPPPTAAPTDSPIPTPLPVDNMDYAVGIQVEHTPDLNSENQDNWYRSVTQDLRLRWVKQQVRWELIEPEPGAVDWSVLDFIVPSALKFDIKLMLSIVTAPEWAREPGVNLGRHGPPADPQIYANFVAEIVKRYPGRIHAIEVWNEQNIDREWTSVQGLNAESYVALLRTTYEAIKVIDPGIIIISGALAPTGWDDGVTAVDDFKFMDQLIAAGMLEWADCIGAHHNGYNISPDYRFNEIPNDPSAVFSGPFDNPHHSWSFRSTLEGYINRVRAVDADAKLCVTEFGWPSAEDLGGARQGFEFALDNTLDEQAEWIPKAMGNMEEWGFVWLAMIWNFNYGPQAGYAISNDNVPYSLIGPGFTFRPAYDSIRTWQRDYLARTGT